MCVEAVKHMEIVLLELKLQLTTIEQFLDINIVKTSFYNERMKKKAIPEAIIPS